MIIRLIKRTVLLNAHNIYTEHTCTYKNNLSTRTEEKLTK